MEMLVISFFPDPPGCHHKEFEEHWSSPSSLSPMQFPQPARIIWPLYPKGVPASLADGACKKEVHNVLLRGVTAEQTRVIIILDSVMSSLEHVSSVQSIGH